MGAVLQPQPLDDCLITPREKSSALRWADWQWFLHCSGESNFPDLMT
jgi:hypothetical protein